MSRTKRVSAAGAFHTAFSNNQDGASSAASRRRRHHMPNEKQQEKCNAIAAAVPADIVGDVLKLMNPQEAVRLSSVCRCWRDPALACDPSLQPTPWMVLMTRSENLLHFRLQSVADASVFLDLNPVIVSPRTALCLNGSWHSWLLLSQDRPTDELFFLLNPFSRVRIDLPPCPVLRDILCITSDPAAPDCAVFAYNSFHNPMVCRPGQGSWTVGAGVCRIDEFSLAVWLKEQLLVLDPIEKQLLTLQPFPLQYKGSVPVSFPEDFSYMNLHLVESEGDLLLFHTRPAYYCVNMSCELIRVFRLDWNTMAFVAAESLGTDRAVFLGGGRKSISVSAIDIGCAADNIYFQNIEIFRSTSRFSWLCYNLKKRRVERVPTRRMPKSVFKGQVFIIPNVYKQNRS